MIRAVLEDSDVLLASPRLVALRRWRPADLDGYAALNRDLEVMAELGGPIDRAVSDGFARYGEDWYAREGLGLLPVIRREDGAFLGMCGLHRHCWYPDDVEIGWRFARHTWGNGYATEAATRWLDHAFSAIGLPRVISITTPANARSLAVMRRLGMMLDHEATHDSGGQPLRVVVHAISANAWRAGRDGPPAATR